MILANPGSWDGGDRHRPRGLKHAPRFKGSRDHDAAGPPLLCSTENNPEIARSATISIS
jgi:hypothetical protein